MDESTDKSALEQVVEIFATHGVEFVVIGGQAETLHGSARVTYDIDLCYRRTRPNLERLADALRPLKPALRDAPPDLPFVIDANALAIGQNFTFNTAFEAVDLLGYVEPLGGYEELASNAEVMEIAGFEVKIISLDDLIRIKQYLGRPKDREALHHLRAIKRIREEESP